ncbi:hypothetical protein I4U23_027199 [Adineta vaga]|nr:hypothetical protein I4U23_027199 [Adineta vaga]
MPTHTIVSGDTFWRLSQVYGCSLQEILAVNPGVVPEQLQIGQTVQVPDNASATSGSGMSTHIIVAGDTFWRLSQVYGCTLAEILAANPGVVPEQLQIGQIVRIPRSGTQKHIIIAGDTFWRLSQQYGCTLEKILAVNPGVVPEQLQIGQTVRIPQHS